MPHLERVHRIAEHCRSRRHLRQQPPVRIAEAQLPIRLSFDLVALLVHGAMMPIAQTGEVGEGRRPALRPVPDVMPLAESHAAAREATGRIAMVEGSP
jgi:hypothetical protein